MTLHQLRIFDVVSRHLNITKASVELHISQPSVFQQIKTLEDSCGVRLYRKIGRGIELTAEGEKLKADAREILYKVESLQQKFQSAQRRVKPETLRVGGSHAPSVSLLPSLLAAFKRTHPLVHVSLQTRRSRTLELLIVNSEIDIAVITHPSGYSEYQRVPFKEERIVAFVSSNHSLAQKKEWTLKDVTKEPLIVHRGLRYGTGAATLQLIKRVEDHGGRANILMECNSAEAVKAAVLRHGGLGVLMHSYLTQEIRRGELKIVAISELDELKVQSLIIYSKDKPLSENAQDFLQLLKQSAGAKGEMSRRRPGSFSPSQISA